MKYMRCVTRGKVRKEVWEMVFVTGGIAAQTQAEQWNASWEEGYIPNAWQIGSSVQLDKQNGKEGQVDLKL